MISDSLDYHGVNVDWAFPVGMALREMFIFQEISVNLRSRQWTVLHGCKRHPIK